MADWNIELALNPGHHEPLFVQLAAALVREIESGRLRPGQRLPGTRTLATRLGVHRNTALAAVRELQSQGWVETRPASGTFVARRIAASKSRQRRPRTERLGFSLPDIAVPPPLPDREPELVDLSSSTPDPRTIPAALLSRAYRRALVQNPSLLDYGDPHGSPRLRRALAQMIADRRGMAIDAEDLLITRGSQMAIWLVARSLVTAGDGVAVESFGYPPAWDALRHVGARLLPIPVDREGLDVDRLRRVVDSHPIKAVYLTPHHQYPTTATLSAQRRLALLELARQHGFAVIEDDYDHEFHYDARPVLPLARLDQHGVVVYVGTFSKVLAPGARVGYLVAPRPLRERMVRIRRCVDHQGDHVLESALGELLEDGEIQRHVRKMRRLYGQRRDAALQLLAELVPSCRPRPAAGGMAFWCDVEGINVESWRRQARRIGLRIRTAQEFAFDRRARNQLRLGFARHDTDELEAALTRLARCGATTS
ncbi:MAG: PLP-dependent aminotransferase family protein [Myxococcales bacterium FL481]|nr:MAG: PLP-dependent aminotransferase family protein [Myxococcales bacterium FL481]